MTTPMEQIRTEAAQDLDEIKISLKTLDEIFAGMADRLERAKSRGLRGLAENERATDPGPMPSDKEMVEVFAVLADDNAATKACLEALSHARARIIEARGHLAVAVAAIRPKRKR